MKAYIVGGDKNLINFLPDLEVTDNLKDAKIVVFGDGPIVSPSLYKEKKDPNVDLKCDINRDRADKSIYTKMKADQIAVGIGRGACFLAVMNGAKLIQYCERKHPKSSYDVEFKNAGKKYIFPAISNWTQGINLLNIADNDGKEFQVLMRSKESAGYSAEKEIRFFMQQNGDPELIKFFKPKSPVSLCMQFHPEWIPEAHLSKLVKEIIYACANS